MKLQFLASAAFIAGMFVTPAFATTALAPGASVNTAFYEDNEVAAGDPEFFETLLDTVVVSVNEKRDGFDGFGVVTDLYDVTVELTARVWAGSTGKLVFGYDFAVTADNGAGSQNGGSAFSVDGFADYDVDFGYLLNSGFPYVPPLIDRSADGDTLSVGYIDPRDPSPGIETFLFVTEAEDYRLWGTGTLDVEITSFGTIPVGIGGLPVPTAVPVPAGLPLLAFGLGMLGWVRRAQRN